MIDQDVETIEAGYEFLLAYAAQGRPAQVESGPGPHARPTVQTMIDAMQNIQKAFADSNSDFEQVIADDCRKAAAAMKFLMAQDKVGSEIVDNLNASIHLRAVLTDLFLYSESLKPLDTDTADAEPAAAQFVDATKQ